MALETRPLAAATALAAAFSLLATPVVAAELPTPAAAKAYDGDAGNVNRDRRWRRHRDRDGVDAGDVIAGVLILGAIAAIADASSSNKRERQERYPDADYRSPNETGRFESRGMDRAVEMCVAEIESGGERVGTVDAAQRDADGWQVSGELERGAPYSCRIGNDGQISDVGVNGAFESYGYGAAPAERLEDGSYDDDYYARARSGQDDDRYETTEAPDF